MHDVKIRNSIFQQCNILLKILLYCLPAAHMREDPMNTENKSTFLDRILDKLRPSDLQTQESRLAVKSRVEHILAETGLTATELGSRIRKDIHSLRTWLSGTRDLTVETLQEFCLSLHISLGDLVME